MLVPGRFAYDATGERVVAWQRSSGQLLDLTVLLRDEGGRVLSDCPLIPVESYGPKRDYLYAGDRLALQLDWSEDDSPVRQYIVVDHLNSTRVVVPADGAERAFAMMEWVRVRVAPPCGPLTMRVSLPVPEDSSRASGGPVGYGHGHGGGQDQALE